jgi:hypothetical protein
MRLILGAISIAAAVYTTYLVIQLNLPRPSSLHISEAAWAQAVDHARVRDANIEALHAVSSFEYLLGIGGPPRAFRHPDANFDGRVSSAPIEQQLIDDQTAVLLGGQVNVEEVLTSLELNLVAVEGILDALRESGSEDDSDAWSLNGLVDLLLERHRTAELLVELQLTDPPEWPDSLAARGVNPSKRVEVISRYASRLQAMPSRDGCYLFARLSDAAEIAKAREELVSVVGDLRSMTIESLAIDKRRMSLSRRLAKLREDLSDVTITTTQTRNGIRIGSSTTDALSHWSGPLRDMSALLDCFRSYGLPPWMLAESLLEAEKEFGELHDRVRAEFDRIPTGYGWRGF